MENSNNAVIIPIGLGLNKVAKDAKKIQDKINDLEKKAAKKQVEIEIKTKDFEDAQQKLEYINESVKSTEREMDKIAKDAQRLAELRFRADSGEKLSGSEASEMFALDAARVDETEQEILDKLTKQTSEQTKIEKSLIEQKQALNEAKSDYDEINEKIKEQKQNLIQLPIKDIGKKLKTVVNNVAKTALAIFGIRTAFTAVSRAMSILSTQDEQLKADIDYIKTALAYTLEPVVRTIVNFVKQLVSYIGYIIKAWTGNDIFEKANKSLKGANTQAQKLNKTIASFDEMQTVGSQSTSTGGSGGGTSDINMPSDKDMEGTFIGWIARNKDTVVNALKAIGIAIAALKLASLLKTLGLFSSLPLWQLAGGIALILGGILLLGEGILAFIEDPSWQNFLTILQGIALIVAGIALLMGAWVVALIALGVAIIAYLIKNWDKVKEILGQVGGWIYDNIVEPVANFFQGMWDKIVEGASVAWEGIKNVFSTVATFFKNIFKNAWEGVKAVFSTGGRIFTGIKDGIVQAFKKIVNAIIDGINRVVSIPFEGINWALQKVRDVDLWGWKPFDFIQPIKIPQIPRLAKGGIVNMPGKGVPVGGALAGEVRPEAVIPFTDSQQMALIGEAIGKFVTIELTNVTELDGRTIARKVSEVNNNTNFLMNR